MRGIAAVCAALACVASAAVAAEPPTLTYGTVSTLHSAALGEDRRLNVYVPAGFPDSTHFDVLYLLDGSAHEDYLHVTGVVDYFVTYGMLPPTMVVGISNVDRRRDFTQPTRVPDDRKAYPTSGHSDAFVTFLGEELLPYVDAHWKTTATRTIVGQSLGGLLATQVLLEHPAYFTRYLIVSPSLWWDEQSLIKGAPAALAAHATAGRTVFVSVSEEPDDMKSTARALDVALNGAHWPGMREMFQFYPRETHATDLHISVYDGLKFFGAAPAAGK